MKVSKGFFRLIMLMALLFTTLAPAAQQSAQAINQAAGTPPASELLPSAPNDIPDLMPSEYVSSFAAADPVLYWYSAAPPCPPGQAEGVDAPTAYPEVIGRTPTYGGTYRRLFYRDVNCGQSDLNSNLIADDQYLYWISISQGGLVRLSKDANITDTPQLMIAGDVSGPGYLTQLGNTIYFLRHRDVGSLIWIDKTTFAADWAVLFACFAPCGKALVTESYYYIMSNFSLYRFNRSDLDLYTIEDNVQDFTATDYTVWFSKSGSNQIFLHENWLEGEYPIYTSPDASGRMGNLVLADNNLFFFEDRNAGCQPFACYDHLLVRMGWDGSLPHDELVFIDHTLNYFPIGLTAAGNFLFYQLNGGLYRLSKNAAALPKQNLWITGMEVTQGIQSNTNQVGLVENRRTFVRVTARSEASAVPGVTAYLYRTDANGNALDGPLSPVNPAGQRLTVNTTSDRNNLNQSFLFELPWSWTTGTQYFYAVVNPWKYPLEPNYSDNGWPTTFPLPAFRFKASPRLETLIVAFGYILKNQSYFPHLVNDILPTYSFIRRTYPLASTPGNSTDPSPGFRPNLWFVWDDGLGPRVDTGDTSNADCNALPASQRNLCASAYINGVLRTMRTTEGIDNRVFMYGMITDRAGFFPRGQEGGSGVSSGPVGNPATRFPWDTDTTYGDWYAAHEIGHSLGRAHPDPNSDDPNTPPPPLPGNPPPAPVVEGCGHSRSDPGYTYPNAEISPAGGAFAGFDGGDREFGIPMRVIPGNVGHDVMSYCNDQWLSDYTYRAIYRQLMGTDLTPNLADSEPLTQEISPDRIPGTVFSSRPKIQGDFLSLAGIIVPESNTAAIQVMQHTSEMAEIPGITPGEYSLHLVDSAGSMLADYPFTPESADDAGTLLSFHQVVDFAAGTAEAQVVRLVDGQVLASQAISANPPAISNVSLTNPTDPVTGTVSLTWSASDPDGDLLSFNVYYSRDDGLTFTPLQMGLQGSSAEVDTARLGGSSSALFRVRASDGVNIASADSAIFNMGYKPPAVKILIPEDGLQVSYGQIINLAAEADDPQDGSQVTYDWSTQYGYFDSGNLTTIYSPAVGENQITVTATNSQGLSASDTITVYVGDDLHLPGPTLTAGPEQISFHVGAGTTDPLTAEVSIGNSGAGDLDWSASSDAAWLTADSAGGTAPATLLVSADPSGLEAGGTYTAHLTISSTASGSSVIIPVALSIGEVWAPPTVITIRSVYLPMLRK